MATLLPRRTRAIAWLLRLLCGGAGHPMDRKIKWADGRVTRRCSCGTKQVLEGEVQG